MARPCYVLFAGVNGAGKSTLYHSGMWQHQGLEDTLPRVNSDEILVARGWSWKSEADQLCAGREALALVKSHLAKHESFNQETTLSGRSIVRNIKQAHEAGYRLILFYVGVEHPSIAQDRIAHHQEIGGHGMASETVERRFLASIDNLVEILDFCDEAYLYDNTALLSMVARFAFGELAYRATETPTVTWHHGIIAHFGYEPTRAIFG